jgi:hypothetical protein
MAAKPVKPKPAKLSAGRTRSTSPKPKQAFVDPLADVPLLGPVTDRFTIQPGDIEFITVGSIEIVIHPSSEADTASSDDAPKRRPCVIRPLRPRPR